jgi:hypothetical protein
VPRRQVRWRHRLTLSSCSRCPRSHGSSTGRRGGLVSTSR